MSKLYKSARGKMVDIDQIKLANETAIAVGNMKINARGDKLGPGGKIVAGRNEIMDNVYQIDLNTGYSVNNADFEREAMVENQKAKELSDLVNGLVNQVPEEEAANPGTVEEPVARGSLASSVAKQTTVVQKPMPKPNKPTGPTRI